MFGFNIHYLKHELCRYPSLYNVSTQALEVGSSLWQVLGREDTFPIFCVLLLVTGVLSYCLAVFQIFLGLDEEKVDLTGSAEETGVDPESTDVWITTELEDATDGVDEPQSGP